MSDTGLSTKDRCSSALLSTCFTLIFFSFVFPLGVYYFRTKKLVNFEVHISLVNLDFGHMFESPFAHWTRIASF